jgi:hypothetical protein
MGKGQVVSREQSLCKIVIALLSIIEDDRYAAADRVAAANVAIDAADRL